MWRSTSQLRMAIELHARARFVTSTRIFQENSMIENLLNSTFDCGILFFYDTMHGYEKNVIFAPQIQKRRCNQYKSKNQ